ncbi:MAG: adenylyltransferase/cytidyltransferase family protein, partial [Patescibacteria group bacterium]|nr:adenylyltransferase/cytidyltransferase family protein [Patescibacteria group bacterium]
MKDYKHAIYIGRFQPFHNAHLEVVRRGLEIAEKVVVVVGSANAAPNIRNPWTLHERQNM